MKEYAVVDTNADNIGGCALCRYKSGKNGGRRRKLDWLKERYAQVPIPVVTRSIGCQRVIEACIANERRATNGSPDPRAFTSKLPNISCAGINRLPAQ